MTGFQFRRGLRRHFFGHSHSSSAMFRKRIHFRDVKCFENQVLRFFENIVVSILNLLRSILFEEILAKESVSLSPL